MAIPTSPAGASRRRRRSSRRHPPDLATPDLGEGRPRQPGVQLRRGSSHTSPSSLQQGVHRRHQHPCPPSRTTSALHPDHGLLGTKRTARPPPRTQGRGHHQHHTAGAAPATATPATPAPAADRRAPPPDPPRTRRTTPARASARAPTQPPQQGRPPAPPCTSSPPRPVPTVAPPQATASRAVLHPPERKRAPPPPTQARLCLAAHSGGEGEGRLGGDRGRWRLGFRPAARGSGRGEGENYHSITTSPPNRTMQTPLCPHYIRSLILVGWPG